jgi:hypothetical protein
MYASVRGRLIKSIEARKYSASIDRYAMIYFSKIESIKNSIPKNSTVDVHCDFFFHRNRIFGQKGQIKKIDVSNRIKQVHDSISKLINIDDSRFSFISARKYAIDMEMIESVAVTITISKGFSEIKREDKI